MGKNKDNGNDKFYFFKIDRDKIKLHLKEIGSKFIPRKNKKKGAILIILFFLLVGVGIGIYTNYKPGPEHSEFESGVTIESIEEEEEVLEKGDRADKGKEKTKGDDREQGPADKELQFASREIELKEENENRKEAEIEPDHVKKGTEDNSGQNENEGEDVVTAPLYPVTAQKSDSISLLRPISGEILRKNGWYFHPVFEDWRYQRGIEIKGNSGDIVMAADSGKVESITEDEYKGIIVTISHSDDWKTSYGHLQKASVSPGEVVGKGQEVGRIGQTSISSQPSLYFELLNEKKVINPVDFFE